MPNRERLQQQIQRLSLADKQALQIWLEEDIKQEWQPPDVEPTSREIVETTQAGHITYQSELVKCGKSNCRCATGEKLHGPYWYGYRKEGGQLKSWYIGKELKLPNEVETADGESF